VAGLTADPLARSAIDSWTPVTSFRSDASGRALPDFLASPLFEDALRIAVPLSTPQGRRVAGVAIVPLADVKHSIGAAIKILLAFVTLDAFVVVLFGSWFLSRAIVAPLSRLAGAADAVAEGRLDLAVPGDGRNEIGVLGQSFNRMTERLRESRARIESQIQRLEEANAELARAEADLIRSEKLASVGHLAAGVAHEIGNPLSSIIGLADMLLRGGGSGFTLAPEAAENARQIRKETERIHRIIRRLLDFSRPAKGEVTEVHVNEIVRETVALTSPSADLRDAEIRLDLDPADPRVLADPNLLQQAIANLLINAGQAMEEGGLVTITTRLRPFEGDAPSGRRSDDPPGSQGGARRRRERPILAGDPVVAIRVADTGEGIPPAILPHLFDPFVTTKAPGRGTGLGLAVVHNIVDLLQGRIAVASDPGKGAVFTIYLRQEGDGA
jgi:signal transduction histidine kinase